nr:hypothetical protein OG999_20655 [Streptomyces sp. NBC_00886]
MGERQSDGGNPGHPRVHSGAAVSEDSRLAALLGTALREGAVDAEAAQRAVAAFRVARDSGTHAARTRRRDDWRPRERYRLGRSVKATLAVFLGSLTLGGVAVAAIGSVGSSHESGAGQNRTHASAAATGSAGQPTSPTPGRTGAPATAKDTLAHCRAYENVKGNGKALESTAWQRFLAAAGGEKNVAAYCAQLAGSGPNGTPKADKSAKAAEKASKAADKAAKGKS